jgi:hypothetical protein
LRAAGGDLGQFVLTHYNGQHDFAVRASLAQHAGTLFRTTETALQRW